MAQLFVRDFALQLEVVGLLQAGLTLATDSLWKLVIPVNLGEEAKALTNSFNNIAKNYTSIVVSDRIRFSSGSCSAANRLAHLPSKLSVASHSRQIVA